MHTCITFDFTVDRKDIETRATVEAYGTWTCSYYGKTMHNSFDIWEYNGKLYRIWQDAERTVE